MDLRRMYYFNATVKYQSFSRAAKSLHISQPSLSNAIKTLELEINAPLIERTTKQFQLTELGQQFYERSKSLLAQFEVMDTELKELAKGEQLEIRLGMIESANHWFSQVIIAYQKQYPQNQITLIDTLYNQTVRQALLGLNVHGVITNQHIVDQEIKSELLYTEPYVVLTKKDHPLATKEKITLVDFAEESLIIGMPEFQTSAQILKAFEQENITPHIQYKIERFEMIKVLVEEGLGIALLPQQYVNHHLSESLISRQVHSDFLSRSVYLSTMKDRTFPESIRKLFELIKSMH
ncbi:DNA-binding transcriptional regulator, LysR family [Psychrobacillus psychrotolerans]|uniref:DNA-binding transcriptional regulator, LysR family n=1 Tax=Psychrobacillus psychrotolerans TaxID=126156 RepID=A0A1I6AUA7_9BACI|nr:LysR family transcriptional regulator [Psychrobacillus psychrotolerans]SFQ72282.1 DNA-binding transcriptional regulator, LysR family [Psychrobacillus psychrotolerans]